MISSTVEQNQSAHERLYPESGEVRPRPLCEKLLTGSRTGDEVRNQVGREPGSAVVQMDLIDQDDEAIRSGNLVPGASQDVVGQAGCDHRAESSPVGRGIVRRGQEAREAIVQGKALGRMRGGDAAQRPVV